MSRKELVKLVAEALKPYGIDDFQITGSNGGSKVVWIHEGKEQTLALPHDADDYRGSRNFRRDVARRMRELGVDELDPEENKVHWKDRLKALEQRVKLQDERIEAMEGMVLEASGNVDDFVRPMRDALMRWATRPELAAPVAPSEVGTQVVQMPRLVEQPKMATPPVEQKKGLKGLEALKEVKWRELQAIAADQSMPPYERILRFLEWNGEPIAIERMKDAKLVGSDAGEISLEMLLQGLRVRRMVDVDKDLYSISEEGSEELDRLDEKERAGSVTPQATPPSALPAQVAVPKLVTPSVAPTPLAASQNERRAFPHLGVRLEDVSKLDMSYVDRALVVLSIEGEKTIHELQMAIGHPVRSFKSLANMIYKSERENGFFTFCRREGGGVYRATDKGLDHIAAVLKIGTAHKRSAAC